MRIFFLLNYYPNLLLAINFYSQKERSYIMTMLLNLTPHTLNIFNKEGSKEILTLAPTGIIPRCSQNNIMFSEINGVPVYRCEFGKVQDLPEKREGVVLVVSRMVVNACPNRDDLVSPGPLLRNKDGQPIGCIGLSK